MAEKDTTTDQAQENQIKKEAWAAMGKVKEILDGLAAIAVLRIQAASEMAGSDLPAPFWRNLYDGTPWVAPDEIYNGGLPVGLEQGLNQLVLRQVSLAWNELNEKAERLFTPEDYRLFTASEEAPGEAET